MENNQPIIVKRVKKVAGGHHGGAWKIAFADFATAMMAFFMVMWLMSSATPEQKKLISGYFQDPVGFSESASPYVIDLGGTPTPAPDKTLNPEAKDDDDPAGEAQGEIDQQQAESIAEEVERERLELLLQELQNKVEENPQLQNFKDQILFEITQDGLRIQIMDAANRPMFASGSAQLQPYFEDILLAMTDTIAAVPNKISVSGHTDAQPFAGRGGYGNWELSADRANAARRVLVAGGYDDTQVARVVGYASSALFDRENPLNPVNRRIDIVVLTKKAQRAIEGAQSDVGAGDVPAAPGAPDAVAPSAPDDPLPDGQLRERLNIFEDGVLQFDQPAE
ncbi:MULTISPECIES: flagellar motor protein MotB [Pseudomonas]|uniref:Flagellar motor protein MotB n=1 Tax=Pseudomonas spirodelae TaxID=3101751 RepID=A0ABU5PAD4_9PSED|nr:MULTISPECIES: flagellar motor protein MotB [unclassified Pseudomonas]MBU0900658.1 flagellar motor protein MotB [Gammaproteobacteria bacterium]MDD2160058.1 flagellar motor protein MotB [Pseudomonas sp. MIL19]MEA1606626.1 flagellar motor protein MotB [Pseudomonas sp. T5W1]